jgi:hypothetical protein
MERQESLRAVNQQMDVFLADIYDEQMITLIDELEHAPVTINSDAVQYALLNLEAYGEDALDLIRYYGQMWGAISARAKEDSHAVSK